MTLQCIALIYLGTLMLVIIVYQLLYNKHRKLLREAIEESEDYRDNLERLTERLCQFEDNAIDGEVRMLEDSDSNFFIVIRDGFIIKTVKYDPSDADDREYKFIHAQEIADKLNEKP